MYSPRIQTLGFGNLGKWTDAMVRGKIDGPLAFAYFFIKPGKQSLEQIIRSKGNIQHFLRVRAPRMPDQIIGRETQHQQIGAVVLAQLFRFNGLKRGT